ncbi:MAG: hypothetical protein ACOYBT_01025 [Polynucleobacter sp.]
MLDARIILLLVAIFILGAISEFTKFFGLDFFTALNVIKYLVAFGLATYFVVGFLNIDLLSASPPLAAGLYACFIPAYDFWSTAEIKAAGLYGYQVNQVMWYADGLYQFGIVLALLVGGYGFIYFFEKSEG